MSFEALVEGASRYAAYVGNRLEAVLLSPSSDLSIGSLLCALAIATVWLAQRHFAANRSLRLKALLRLLFPKRWLLSRSAALDVRLLMLNLFVFGVILAGAVISHRAVSGGLRALLDGLLGANAKAPVPDLAAAAIATVALFLAYELAYWVYHYLSHTVPALWEMHKVHHSAEVLTPLTNSRVHPIESVLFLNTLAIFMGTTDGIVTWALGRPVQPITIANANLLVVVCTYLLAHLHHTHVWIAFSGPLGRMLISPAHHQIHHSTNPIHFNKNLGSVLAIWDWLFGTLHVPGKKRERLTFGIGDGEPTEHTVAQELLRPVAALATEARRMAGASEPAQGPARGQ
ncbi:MAG: sterol desaturase family protein [Hyphomicrobiaceae bacterium]|nr:sterol desaturase family protein [Hyphomicrobiaceae bacterium]